ncbi:MAG: DUF2851 family protein [Bacteroidia bacterium]|nr:DUF2851 family protein [Bacteroidia bacterium]
MIPESFLHYVWRTRNFDTNDLQTTDGLPVVILQPGVWNHDQGPDFFQALIRVGEIEWSGQVEIHVHSKEWYLHGHDHDPLYNNTILHIVLHTQGEPVRREDGTTIPEVVLEGRIAEDLLQRYYRFSTSQEQIPCAPLIGGVAEIYKINWIERLAVERVSEKAHKITARFPSQNMDWTQALWEELMVVMGGPVNKETFRWIAEIVPWKIMQFYTGNPFQMEALLIGIAGLFGVSKSFDEYHQKLREEWEFLSAKHKLETPENLQIRFMRMRPAAFPTIRISQTAYILHFFPHLIRLLEPENFDIFLQKNIGVSAYWETHYRFFQSSPPSRKWLGDAQKELLMINAVLPLAWLYHRAHGRDNLSEMIADIFTRLTPENNRITRVFTTLGLHNQNALHSQGMIQLKKHYCDEKRCLECNIGHQLLK